MKLLLDENLPKRLKLDFYEHAIFTVSDKGWNGKKNGELLGLLRDENFDALFTFDRNLQYQQNFEKYPVAVLVLQARDNTYATLKPQFDSSSDSDQLIVRDFFLLTAWW